MSENLSCVVQDWGVLEVGFPVRSNSYAGHVWSARLDGKVRMMLKIDIFVSFHCRR